MPAEPADESPCCAPTSMEAYVDPKRVHLPCEPNNPARTSTFPKAPFADVGLDIDDATFVDVPAASMHLYHSLLEFGAEASDALGELFVNPEDPYEPEFDDDELDTTVDSDDDSDDDIGGFAGLEHCKPRVPRLQLGHGVTSLVFNDVRVFMLHYGIVQPVAGGFDPTPKLYRGVAMAVAGREPSAKITIKELCTHAMKWKQEKDNKRAGKGKYTLYRLSTDRDCTRVRWKQDGIKTSRPFDKVFLPNKDKQALIDDMSHFFKRSTRRWYMEHGLPYRRSYLFYGSPGTGKTTLIRTCAGHFRLNLCFLSLTNRNFSNQALADAFSSLPRNSALVIEDFDSLFVERKNEDGAELTFSGLLNALDGLVSCDGIVTFLTTNEIKKMDKQDPALLRAGRVDRRFKFNLPEKAQIGDMFRSFFKTCTEDDVAEFTKAVLDRREQEARSIATLQQFFIYSHGTPAEKCPAMVPFFFDAFFPDKKDVNMLYA